MKHFTDHNDPKRTWHDLGGDLEGSFDGFKYVDIRNKSTKECVVFASKGIFEKALSLIPQENEF